MDMLCVCLVYLILEHKLNTISSFALLLYKLIFNGNNETDRAELSVINIF